MLRLMKGTTMTNDAPANVTPIEDAAAIRWLTVALEHARREAQTQPSPDAVARMRARIFSETAKKSERLAA